MSTSTSKMRSLAAFKAAATRKSNQVSARQRAAAFKAWDTRRANEILATVDFYTPRSGKTSARLGR